MSASDEPQQPAPPARHDIFVSYSRADRARVEPIVRMLEQHGWSVWWDPEILPGQKFHEVIDGALTAARCVIVAWSENSADSDWVVGEASEAKARGVLVPLRLDDARLRIDFRSIQTADFSGWSGDPAAPPARRLRAGVSQHLGEPEAAPIEAPPAEPRAPSGARAQLLEPDRAPSAAGTQAADSTLPEA